MSGGLISGTPAQAGEWTFWVSMTDVPASKGGEPWCSDDNHTERQFSIKVIQGLQIDQRQSVLGPAVVNQSYSLQLTAQGGGTQVWSIASGTAPAGMTINSGTGLLSGTPTQTGDFTFQVKVTDGSRTNAQTYTLSVVQPLAVTSRPQKGAEVGIPVSVQPSATGGRQPYRWSAANLATGLTINPATGAITGTPTAPSSGPAKVTITDSIGLTQTFDVNVAVAERLAVVKGQPLPGLKVGKAYRARLSTTGGVAPRTWTILGGKPGTLPPGIKFNKRTGQFTGTPTKAGTWRLRMQAADGFGVKSSLPVILKVKA
jgi:hypothetical protein